MTPHEHMKMQKKLQKESYDFALVAPPGTGILPLAERLHIYLHVFESGCSVSQPPVGDGKPESCPECVRAFVNAVKNAVDEVIADDPMGAMKRMVEATTGSCPACHEEGGAHKEGCEPASYLSAVRIYTPPRQDMPRCECGGAGSNHVPGCPKGRFQ